MRVLQRASSSCPRPPSCPVRQWKEPGADVFQAMNRRLLKLSAWEAMRTMTIREGYLPCYCIVGTPSPTLHISTRDNLDISVSPGGYLMFAKKVF